MKTAFRTPPLKRIEDILREADPQNLIKFHGAPTTEYNGEAREIFRQLTTTQAKYLNTVEDVANIVAFVFLHSFETLSFRRAREMNFSPLSEITISISGQHLEKFWLVAKELCAGCDMPDDNQDSLKIEVVWVENA